MGQFIVNRIVPVPEKDLTKPKEKDKGAKREVKKKGNKWEVSFIMKHLKPVQFDTEEEAQKYSKKVEMMTIGKQVLLYVRK